MTHPAADLLHAIADGKQMEEQSPASWSKCSAEKALFLIAGGSADRVRIAREMVTRTVTYPAPLREKPKIGSNYYYPGVVRVDEYIWAGDAFDLDCFSAGMAFATREDAEAAYKALFGGGQ